MFKRTLLAAITLAISGVASAQMSPVGTWHTIDDKSGAVRSEVVVSESAGIITGKVTKLLRKDVKQDVVCDECSGDRKDKPVLGMEIIRGVKKAEGKDVWEGGKVLDPESGKEYAARLTPIEGGKKMEMRGSIFGIGRTQTWVRVQ